MAAKVRSVFSVTVKVSYITEQIRPDCICLYGACGEGDAERRWQIGHYGTQAEALAAARRHATMPFRRGM